MIIRAKTMRAWIMANLKDSLSDIASHGADCGYYGITYNSDMVKLFNRFEKEIWDAAYEDAEAIGYKNVCAMVAEFRRSDMIDDIDTFKALMVWYYVEKIAREHEDNLG
ncbi:hypothetical protein [Anaeroselena agilis]|uniref:DUF7222 domain-containing protein n=1 Tax=Anaeroselena agilis TaxID=3063788 RepID=A0ABU3NVS2_9FIRM|nr:hypothetical protein [Selenomonadales bacterium 4137-cl]